MPTDFGPNLFGSIKDGGYKGLYPGADPYAKAQMIQQQIPSANQEALQNPKVDPINAAAMAASGGGMVMSPNGVSTNEFPTAKYAVQGAFGYIMNQLLGTAVNQVRNTTIDKFTGPQDKK